MPGEIGRGEAGDPHESQDSTVGLGAFQHTFPDPSPKHISIVDVHHDPLIVQRVFIAEGANMIKRSK